MYLSFETHKKTRLQMYRIHYRYKQQSVHKRSPFDVANKDIYKGNKETILDSDKIILYVKNFLQLNLMEKFYSNYSRNEM